MRNIRVLSIRIIHPRRPEPSYITLDLELAYLKGEPVESIVLTEEKALELAEQALSAARVLRRVREQRAQGQRELV